MASPLFVNWVDTGHTDFMLSQGTGSTSYMPEIFPISYLCSCESALRRMGKSVMISRDDMLFPFLGIFEKRTDAKLGVTLGMLQVPNASFLPQD